MALKEQILKLIDDEIESENKLGNERHARRLHDLRAEIEKLIDQEEKHQWAHQGRSCVEVHKGLSHEVWETRVGSLMTGFKEGRGDE